MENYYARNKERILAIRQEYYKQNRAYIREQQQTYYQRKKGIHYIFSITHQIKVKF
jgi:hypothetical protein